MKSNYKGLFFISKEEERVPIDLLKSQLYFEWALKVSG